MGFHVGSFQGVCAEDQHKSYILCKSLGPGLLKWDLDDFLGLKWCMTCADPISRSEFHPRVNK